jgi:hypothetical protein
VNHHKHVCKQATAEIAAIAVLKPPLAEKLNGAAGDLVNTKTTRSALHNTSDTMQGSRLTGSPLQDFKEITIFSLMLRITDSR